MQIQNDGLVTRVLTLVFLGTIAITLVYPYVQQRVQAVHFESQYQAVLLTGGQVYYGKLEGFGTAYPVLRDVYYVKSQVNPETKQVASVLVRRGKEWHAPDRMYLNPGHIVLVEPVSPDSQVAQLIASTPK